MEQEIEELGSGSVTLASQLVAITDSQERQRAVAQHCQGWNYASPRTQRIMDLVDWTDWWPVCDANGRLTGDIVDSQDDYYNVDDVAMIADSDLPYSVVQEIERAEEDGTFSGYVCLRRHNGETGPHIH